MSVTEFERHQILQWFQEQLGPERGEVVMRLMAPVGWGDIATTHDLQALEGRLDARFVAQAAELRGEMAGLRGEMAELRGDLRGEMAQLRGQMDGMRGELGRTLVTWMLASQATLVGLVLAAVRFGA